MAENGGGIYLVVKDLAPLVEALRGCTLVEVGAAAGGVSKGYLSQLVNGRRRTVSVEMAARIEDAVGADRGSMFTISPPDRALLAPYSADRRRLAS